MRKSKKQINRGLWEMEVTINRNRKQRVDNVRRNDRSSREQQKGKCKCEEKKCRRKKRTSKGNGKNKTDKVKIKWHKSSREKQTSRCKCEGKSCRKTRKKILSFIQPACIIKTQHTVLRSRHKNRKTGRNQAKMSPATTTAAITSHYSPAIKAFTACLGGESVAETIHHCSVTQITDRPSPPLCSSESQINQPDTSNDSAWKRRYSLQTQIHTCTLGKNTHTLHMSVANNCPEAEDGDDQRWLLIGAFVSTAIVSIISLRQPCDFSEVITTQDLGICGIAALLIH